MRRGRRRHLPGHVLRRHVARPRRLPAPRRRPGAPVGVGAWSYEVADTKLARHVKAERAPPDLRLHRPAGAGPGRPPSGCTSRSAAAPAPSSDFRVADYMAYYRRARDRFLATIDGRRRRRPTRRPPPTRSPSSTATSAAGPSSASARRRADDHLSLVAGITARQRRALSERGVGTRRGARRARAAAGSRARGHQRRAPWSGSASRRASRSRVGARAAARYELLQPGRRAPSTPSAGLAVAAASRRPATSSSTSRATRSRRRRPRLPLRRSSRRGRRRSTRSGRATTTASSRSTASGARSSASIDFVVERLARRPGRCTSTTTRRTSRPRSSGSWAATGRARTRSTACSAGGVLVDLCGWSGRAAGVGRELLDQEAGAALRLRRARSTCATPARASSSSRSGSSWARASGPRRRLPRAHRALQPATTASQPAACATGWRRVATSSPSPTGSSRPAAGRARGAPGPELTRPAQARVQALVDRLADPAVPADRPSGRAEQQATLAARPAPGLASARGEVDVVGVLPPDGPRAARSSSTRSDPIGRLELDRADRRPVKKGKQTWRYSIPRQEFDIGAAATVYDPRQEAAAERQAGRAGRRRGRRRSIRRR